MVGFQSCGIPVGKRHVYDEKVRFSQGSFSDVLELAHTDSGKLMVKF